MKKAFSILLFAALFLSSCLAEPAIYQEGEFSYRLTDQGAVVTDWENWTDDEALPQLHVPATLGGMPVVGIGLGAFGTCFGGPYSVGFDIIVPEGVTFLEENAFECCSNAMTIYLPSTLEEIPEGCFIHVGADIVFPNGNPYFTSKDGFLVDTRTSTLLYAAISSCENPIPSVKRLGNFSLDNWMWTKDNGRDDPALPESLESIGSLVFYDLPDLTRITLPDGITRLDPQCFYATDLQEIHLPASLTEIPPYCFEGCSLTSVVIPEGVTRIGEFAFYSEWQINEPVVIPASVQFVGFSAFDEDIQLIPMNPNTHFETFEEYSLRCPEAF